MKLNDRDFWETPLWVVNGLFTLCKDLGLVGKFKHEIDVAANECNSKCEYYIDEEMDTLTTPWGTNFLCWCNPPYSNVEPFIKKAVAETVFGNHTVMLLKNDCSTKWFELALKHATAVIFITGGRINFIPYDDGEKKKGSNFSSVAFVFTNMDTEQQTFYLNREQLKEIGGYND